MSDSFPEYTRGRFVWSVIIALLFVAATFLSPQYEHLRVTAVIAFPALVFKAFCFLGIVYR